MTHTFLSSLSVSRQTWIIPYTIQLTIIGFTIASIVNVDFDGSNNVLLCIYSVCSALSICFLIFTAVTSSYLLISVYKFDVYKTNVERFDQYWIKYCEDDWKSCFNYLTLGVFLFVLVLVEVSWISMAHHKDGATISIIVTIGVLITTAFWYANIYFKWTDFLRNGNSKYPVYGRQQQSSSTVSSAAVDSGSMFHPHQE